MQDIRMRSLKIQVVEACGLVHSVGATLKEVNPMSSSHLKIGGREGIGSRRRHQCSLCVYGCLPRRRDIHILYTAVF